ncbi:MAG TPA: hypothetical protein PLW65_12955 [Pseudomonadota bacterium]|nr:hypothetical protein [Pseudomonadota bacterium]
MQNLRLKLRLVGLLAAVALGLAGPLGCGASGSCDTFADDYCARLSECDPVIYAALSGGDAAICRARFAPLCTRSVAIEGVKFTADGAGQCGKGVRAASCDDLLGGNLPAVCTPPGSRADGASCSDSLQCASTRCTGSATTCGTCVPRLKSGEACQSSGQCQYGLYCKLAGTGPGACTPYVQVGQSCAAGDQCLPTLFCNTGGQPSGTCAARRAAGEACSRNADCDNQKSLVCDSASKQCVAYTVNYIEVGASCANSGSTTSFNICRRDAHCVTTTTTGGGSTSTCVAALAAGQSCNNLDSECAAGLTCTSQVCQSSPVPQSCL